MILAALAASSPDVGSSRKMRSGFLIKATANDNRRFCPPDKPLHGNKKRKPSILRKFLLQSSG
eukprot:1877855-Amphidinium_carterae.1